MLGQPSLQTAITGLLRCGLGLGSGYVYVLVIAIFAIWAWGLGSAVGGDGGQCVGLLEVWYLPV